MKKNQIKDFKDKTAIITGASEGLGRYLCKYFAGMGFKVFGIARKKDQLKSLEGEVNSMNCTIKTFPANVADYKKMEQAVNEIIRIWGKIDVLINCAGTGTWNASIENQTQESIDSVIDTNLKGMVYLTRHVASHMIKAKRGHIFNISSTSGIRGSAGNTIYCATKFGVNGFSEALAKDLLPYNIHVANLYPGGIDTSWWDKVDEVYINRDEMIAKEDIAELIKFILLQPKRIFYKEIIIPPVKEFTEFW